MTIDEELRAEIDWLKKELSEREGPDWEQIAREIYEGGKKL